MTVIPCAMSVPVTVVVSQASRAYLLYLFIISNHTQFTFPNSWRREGFQDRLYKLGKAESSDSSPRSRILMAKYTISVSERPLYFGVLIFIPLKWLTMCHIRYLGLKMLILPSAYLQAGRSGSRITDKESTTLNKATKLPRSFK